MEVPALASQWSVGESAVRDAVQTASTTYGTNDLGVIFLLAKGVMSDDDDMRQLAFKRLLNPPDDAWKAKRARLNRLVALEGDTTFDKDP